MRGLSIAAVAIAALLGSSNVLAQTPEVGDPSRPLLRRDALQLLLADLEALAVSASDDGVRADARRRAQLVRARLEQGDFGPGDRILLRVESEPQLSDTFVVDVGPVVSLPDVGDVPLMGVLRSELQAHMTEYLSRFIRDPRVQARALMRIALIGAVQRPGFYTLASADAITAVIMTAGGPTDGARLDKMRIERGREVVWDGSDLQAAIQQGATLDQLSLRPGDQITIPQRRGTNLLTVIGLLTSVPLAIAALVQIF